MAQMSPSYPFMTSQVNEIFVNPLVGKYGFENVIWPIAIVEKNLINCYIYEVNSTCSINSKDDNRPSSKANLINYFVDYTSEPRVIIPPFEKLVPFIDNSFQCSYDFIVKSDEFQSVDIDYVWFNKSYWKAIELTTVWKPLSSKEEAERLVKMFNRRPSWGGASGAHGIRTLINASVDLSLDYYFVVVNSKDGVSNNLDTNSNAFWFPLNHENVDRILQGHAPINSEFSNFSDLTNWL